MTSISTIEHDVIDMLLAKESILLTQLRKQLSLIVERSIKSTGSGFVVQYQLSNTVIPVDGAPTFDLGNVDGIADEVPDGIGFVLFIKSGIIDSLEGYVYSGEWPPRIKEVRLQYNSEMSGQPVSK